MEVITQEEIDEKAKKANAAREEFLAKSRELLGKMSDEELDFLVEVTTRQTAMVIEEKARRGGCPTPYVTIVVTDVPVVDARTVAVEAPKVDPKESN